jgi:NAD+ synthase (glutamine-hydrolysing)
VKIGLAQVDAVVGDLEGNADTIVRESASAAERGADLVVFPELALLGYPPLDLLDEPEFVHQAMAARATLVARLGAEVGDLPVAFGTIGLPDGAVGKALQNVAVLARGGVEVAVRPKSLLPSYDVFDEDRWFQPGCDARPVDASVAGGRPLGLTVCEDIWNDASFWQHRIYARDPVAELAGAGAAVIVNLSASPYHRGKSAPREEMLRATARHHGRPVVYVNQVGANDELIFDGGSLVVDADGAVRARAPVFEAATLVVDMEGAAPPAAMPPAIASGSIEELRRALVLGIRDYAKKCGFRVATLGLSGGIDSAVVACLAADALGAANVEGVLMPSRFTSQASNDEAAVLGRRLGIATRVVPIESLHAGFLEALAPHFAGRPTDVTEENLQARVRGTILMALSNKLGSLVLATGNKAEMAVGYCTLYGDMVGGIAPLGDCSKAWVRELARHVNRDGEIIPAHVIDRPPSAELRADQRDEDDLPPYAVLDRIVEGFVERRLTTTELEAEGFDPATVRRVRRLLDRSEYKRRQAAPILRVTPRAFGPGRRLPIARRVP